METSTSEKFYWSQARRSWTCLLNGIVRARCPPPIAWESNVLTALSSENVCQLSTLSVRGGRNWNITRSCEDFFHDELWITLVFSMYGQLLFGAPSKMKRAKQRGQGFTLESGLNFLLKWKTRRRPLPTYFSFRSVSAQFPFSFRSVSVTVSIVFYQ